MPTVSFHYGCGDIIIKYHDEELFPSLIPQLFIFDEKLFTIPPLFGFFCQHIGVTIHSLLHILRYS